MTVRASGCKKCGQNISGGLEWRLAAVQYPYNPEWTPVTVEAGIFCSKACLANYLAAVEVAAQS